MSSFEPMASSRITNLCCLLDTASMNVIGKWMFSLQQLRRVFDTKPWVAHLYVTEQCNLDCHYCNEFNNSIPHPALADLKKWMDHIRKLEVMRLGLQGGEPLKHPDIVEIVRYAKSIGFCQVSMSTNGFLLNCQLLADLEGAGLDELQISVDRMTPIPSTRKAMKSIVHKLDWFKDSKVRLNVSGVMFKDTLDEMAQVIDTCLDLGIAVRARVIHDDLVHDRALRNGSDSEPLLRFLDHQEKLKRSGQKIRSSWNLLTYQKKMLRQEPIDWTCIAGYKYFFVSSTGKFWLCSQVRTERHILEITPEDLLGYNRKKNCQARCGVYCTAEASLAVSHPLRYAGREVAGMLASRVSRMRRGGPERIRDLTAAQ
jgi:MoaA/NifB/PqqE/SkfB family radical SAM enzyme